MRFVNPVPDSLHFQTMAGWGSILGTIGGLASFAIPGVGPALGTAILSAGSAVGQGIDAARAEKKASQQMQDAARQQTQAYQAPYQLGLNASNTLAGLLGVEGVQAPMGLFGQGGMMPPVTDTGPSLMQRVQAMHDGATPQLSGHPGNQPQQAPVLSQGSRLMDLVSESRRPKNQSSYAKGRD